MLILFLAVAFVVFREWDKTRRAREGSSPQPTNITTTPLLRMTRSSDGTGIVVRVVRSNELVQIVVSSNLPSLNPSTNQPPEPAAINQTSPPAAPVRIESPEAFHEAYPRSVTNIIEAQIALDRLWISPGAIDGVHGRQTRNALRVFQSLAGRPPTGELDAATQATLLLHFPALTNYILIAGDCGRLAPVSGSWSGKAAQVALDFESHLECVAERFHASQPMIRKLNPAVDWSHAAPDVRVQVPAVSNVAPVPKASRLLVSLGEKSLRALDASGRVIAYFPCSIARRVEKRPAGALSVVSIAEDPNYTFDPRLFPESPEARALRTKLVIPPGPNNPVGVAWIGLSLPGYGIHGTPHPEQVGRTESHGCFRLTNWNADRLLRLAWIGLPVQVDP